MSEQRRARRITEQIETLKQMVEGSGRTVKKDKYSVLVAVTEYISELQSTVAQAQNVPRGMPPAPGAPELHPGTALRTAEVDYRSVFVHSGVAQAVAGIDGNFLDCNRLFTALTGYGPEELRSRSIFNLTPAAELQHMFAVIGSMMHPEFDARSRVAAGGMHVPTETKRFRKVCKTKRGPAPVLVHMTLVRGNDGQPLHFACAVLPMRCRSTAPGSTCELVPPEHAHAPNRVASVEDYERRGGLVLVSDETGARYESPTAGGGGGGGEGDEGTPTTGSTTVAGGVSAPETIAISANDAPPLTSVPLHMSDPGMMARAAMAPPPPHGTASLELPSPFPSATFADTPTFSMTRSAYQRRVRPTATSTLEESFTPAEWSSPWMTGVSMPNGGVLPHQLASAAAAPLPALTPPTIAATRASLAPISAPSFPVPSPTSSSSMPPSAPRGIFVAAGPERERRGSMEMDDFGDEAERLDVPTNDPFQGVSYDPMEGEGNRSLVSLGSIAELVDALGDEEGGGGELFSLGGGQGPAPQHA